MVVLTPFPIPAAQANDLACRWNKAGKCGSCSAEINGLPKLMCMTRLLDVLPLDKPVTVEPMRRFRAFGFGDGCS
jgi:succinate dehydrogenase / fumarate reductase iron-sulfur subunit